MWERLEDLWTWEGVLGEWEPCIAAGLPRHWLEPTGSLATQTTLPDGRRLELVDEAGDGVALCADTGQWLTVEHKDRVEYALSEAALTADLVLLLGVRARPDRMDQRFWRLGDWRPNAHITAPVYLTLHRERAQVFAYAARAAAQTRGPFVFLTGTSRTNTDSLVQSVDASGGVLRALETIACTQGDGILALTAPLEAQFADWLSSIDFAGRSRPGLVRFPTPSGATWGDVELTFIDGYTVAVRIRGVSRWLSYRDLGMEDRRTKEPDSQFELLRIMAQGHGTLSWDHPKAQKRNQKRRERLAAGLRACFGIDGDPFMYDEDLKGWRSFCRFGADPTASSTCR